MFDKKVSTLLNTKKVENAFVREGIKASNETLSGNGSLKYSTSGNDFVDNFCSISKFKEPRSYNEIAADMERLWSQDPLLCLKLTVYIRLITRKSKILEKTYNTQKGQGLRHEGIMRLMWLAINHKNTFQYNFPFFIAAGSWKDVFTMLNLDLQYNGWKNRKLDWNLFRDFIVEALFMYNDQTNLVRKYLPTIRTNSKCKTLESQADTIIGRWLAYEISKKVDSKGNKIDKSVMYRNYRQIKSYSFGHQWQQLISNQLYDAINFDKIPGRALNLMVNSKFLYNHNLREKYLEWIKPKTSVKYTGFVFELFKPLEPYYNYYAGKYKYDSIDEATKQTINAQFETLLNGENIESTFLVAKDISSSMTSKAMGCSVSSYSVAKGIALYFSKLLSGPFANSYIDFDDKCEIKQWKGNTPVENWINDGSCAYGSTNFISISRLFGKIKNNGVPENEFPNGLLCISDGEFDARGENNITTFNRFREILREEGFSDEYVKNFKLVLWDVPNNYYGKHETKFEDFTDAPNSFHISGYDPSVVSFLMGKGYNPCNSKELFEAVMNQELLNDLKVVE
jgi:hypothetical protein